MRKKQQQLLTLFVHFPRTTPSDLTFVRKFNYLQNTEEHIVRAVAAVAKTTMTQLKK